MGLEIAEYQTGAYGMITAYCLGGIVNLTALAPDAYDFRREVSRPEQFWVGREATIITRLREPHSLRASLPPLPAAGKHRYLYSIDEPVRYIQRLDTAKEHRRKGLAAELVKLIEQDNLTYGIVQKVNPHHDFVLRAHLAAGYSAIPVIPDRDISIYPFTLLLRDARETLRPAA